MKRLIERVQAIGAIRGYTTVVDHDKLGRPLTAFAELRFAGDTRVADIAGITTGLAEVEAVYTIAGTPMRSRRCTSVTSPT